MSAAAAESRYASGASLNFVMICTPARALAESAKIPYTNSRTRPGPVPIAASRGRVEAADGLTNGPRRNLLQAQHENRNHQAGYAQDEVAPPGRFHPRQHEGRGRERDRGDQVADERGRLARPVGAEQPRDR